MRPIRRALAAGVLAAALALAGGTRAAGPPRTVGPLILDGGGVSSYLIFDRIAAEIPAGGALCIIDTATSGGDDPRALFEPYMGLRTQLIAIDPAAARKRATVEALRGCAGFFFNGGNPEALSRAFMADGGGTPALAAVREQVEQRGIMFSGSSAGAMIVGALTLCECSAKSSIGALTEGKLFEAPGFGFVEGVLVDAHFFARGLLGRHLYALAENRIPVGVGIDEGAAVAVPRGGGAWEVVGDGAVALIGTPPGARTGRLDGFTISLLRSGDVFDPHTGAVIVAPERLPLNVPRSGAAALLFQDAFAPRRIQAAIERLAQSGASEATAAVRGAKIRVRLRKTPATKSYSDGRTFTVLGIEVSIEQTRG